MVQEAGNTQADGGRAEMNYKYYKEIVCKTYIPQAGMDCDCEACKQTKKEIEECKFDIENNCELEYDE